MITAGQRFGRLTALRRIPRRWVCRCDCGECAPFTPAGLKHARQCPVCAARDALHARTANLLTPEEQQMLFSLSISPAGAYLFTPQGGGSGPPSWVPQAPSGDYALVYSDFAHDRYWVGNSAGVGAQATLLDVWGENLDFGPFFPGQIGGGLGLWGTNAQGTNSAVMLEAVAAPLIAGFTHVMTLYADPAGVSTESTSLVAFADLPAENQYYEQDTRLYSTASPTSFISSDLANVHIVNQQDGGGVKKTAATFLFTTQTISYMGGAILSCIGSAPLPDSYLAISNNNTDTSSPFAYIQSVAFFRPQPDAALPTLSTP